MEIQIVGRHVSVSEAMKEHARRHGEKLAKYFDGITRIDVTLTVENERQLAEFVAGAPRGVTLVAKEQGTDMYAAIDAAAAKLERQIKKLKEKFRDRRDAHRRAEFMPQ